MIGSEKFRKLVRNKLKFGLFLFSNLPIAFLSGVRVIEISENKALVRLPFKFLTKNPFKSVYFASQAMASELSTGILALSHTYEHKPAISMLVFNMKANFIKKAKTKIQFECSDGLKIKDAVEQCINSREGVTVEVKSVGKDKFGDIVSEFYYTWTFKPKK